MTNGKPVSNPENILCEICGEEMDEIEKHAEEGEKEEYDLTCNHGHGGYAIFEGDELIELGDCVGIGSGEDFHLPMCKRLKPVQSEQYLFDENNQMLQVKDSSVINMEGDYVTSYSCSCSFTVCPDSRLDGRKQLELHLEAVTNNRGSDKVPTI